MRLTPHLGTLLFPPLAVAAVAAAGLLRAGRSDRDILFGSVLAALLVMFVLAAVSWRFLRRHPSVGVFFSGCLLLVFPYAIESSTVDALQFAVGAGSALGGFAGLLYFGGRGVLHARRRRQARPLGFPVIPVGGDPPDVPTR